MKKLFYLVVFCLTLAASPATAQIVTGSSCILVLSADQCAGFVFGAADGLIILLRFAGFPGSANCMENFILLNTTVAANQLVNEIAANLSAPAVSSVWNVLAQRCL